MITITLLHPTQSVSVQSWTFESESVVRIGRANDNDVIIYSAVVSRHHVELWKDPSGWEIINFGANGTYVNGEPVVQVSVMDGMTIRLGNSGPKLQVWLGTREPKEGIKIDGMRSLAVKLDNSLSDEDTSIAPNRRPPINRKSPQIDDNLTLTDFD